MTSLTELVWSPHEIDNEAIAKMVVKFC
jgi:hypothetical protein